MFHWEETKGAVCGATCHNSSLVDRPVRSDCAKCRKLAGLKAVAIELTPSRDKILEELLNVLCKTNTAERSSICTEALAILEKVR